MAIIDILQHYDAKKKAAHAAKTVKHGVRGCLHLKNYDFYIMIIMTDTRVYVCVSSWQAGAEISTVNPEQYSKRFYDFITTILS